MAFGSRGFESLTLRHAEADFVTSHAPRTWATAQGPEPPCTYSVRISYGGGHAWQEEETQSAGGRRTTGRSVDERLHSHRSGHRLPEGTPLVLGLLHDKDACCGSAGKSREVHSLPPPRFYVAIIMTLRGRDLIEYRYEASASFPPDLHPNTPVLSRAETSLQVQSHKAACRSGRKTGFCQRGVTVFVT